MRDHIPSQLQKYQPRSPTSPEEFRKLATAAWQDRHVLVFDMNDPAIIIDPFHRQACENIGNKLYGERVKK